jgi:hypothetical protein
MILNLIGDLNYFLKMLSKSIDIQNFQPNFQFGKKFTKCLNKLKPAEKSQLINKLKDHLNNSKELMISEITELEITLMI